MMSVLERTLHRARAFAPAISIAMLMLLPVLIRRDIATASAPPAPRAAMVAAFSNAPYRIGRWIGADVPLPEAAGQQLRPTAALSRRYVHMDHAYAVDVTIIQSGDSRDMVGHHPPICYPSNGWVAVDSASPAGSSADRQGSQVQLQFADQQVSARRYEYVRRSELAGRVHIRVFNFFVLPDGRMTGSIEEVHQQTSWLQTNTSGVAQVQVLTLHDLPESVARDVTGEILGGLTSVFEAVGVRLNGPFQ